ncbi:peptidylprolyl isomerase [bacterium]|nr:peptidylprolyl isomerase [bacterium]
MKIIANVYDYQINQEEFDYAQVLFSDCSCGEKENNKKAIDYLIDRYLLLFEADKFGVEVTDEEWNERIFEASQKFESQDQYFDYLKEHKLNRIRYEEFLKESLIINKFLDKFASFIKDRVTKDVSNFAETNSELFSCCPQAHVYNILLLGATEENFKKLMHYRKEINTLEDFKRIADLYSECPAGIKCGDMGFVTADTFIEELDSVIFTLPLNEVSLPVKSKLGYHLILVTERNDNPHFSDDEKKDFMLNCLIDNKSELYLHCYVDELRKEASEKNKIIVNI